jgi:para-nitrobenzyl esterase
MVNTLSFLSRSLLFLLLVMVGACDNDDNDDSLVLSELTDMITTRAGSIQGSIIEQGQILHFQGIPFAEPPVGPFRWQQSVEKASWDDVLLTQSASAACIQADPESQLTQSEDCLYLNVAVPSEKPDEALPVMVWFHGGGDENGSGSEGIYNIVSLAQSTGHVVVSVNSRLGFLGFLSLPELADESTDGSHGNYHHQDQQLALQWVRENIGEFNGDKGNVTLFGESAGGNDVCRHLSSRQSDGLFHRAILQSSTCSETILQTQEARFSQGEFFKTTWACDMAVDSLDCMRQQSALELRSALTDEGKTGNLLTGDLFNQEKFRPAAAIDGVIFTALPRQAIAQAPAGVEAIIGVIRNETTLFTQSIGSINPENNLSSYQEILVEGIPELTDEQVTTLTTELYPCGDYPSCSDAYADLVADSVFVCPSLQAADAMLEAGNLVYVYEFIAPVNTALLLGATIQEFDENAPAIGIPHSADLFYLWDLGVLQAGENPAAVVAQVRDYWGSFASEGEPVSDSGPRWPRYSSAGGEYLEINSTSQSRTGFKQEVCNYFSTL